MIRVPKGNTSSKTFSTSYSNVGVGSAPPVRDNNNVQHPSTAQQSVIRTEGAASDPHIRVYSPVKRRGGYKGSIPKK